MQGFKKIYLRERRRGEGERHRKRGRESGERERNVGVREKHRLVASCIRSNQGEPTTQADLFCDDFLFF